MNREQNRDFILKTESLVKPKDVTTISFLGDFNKFLPKKMQHKIMLKGSGKIPYMGFIVDPYCFFLAYKIKDRAAAQAMLPADYELAESSVFSNGEKYPMVIISAFFARTSAFIGMRLEFYIIARSKKTGLISWIISDYETNTTSHDPKNQFSGYTGDPGVITVSPYGELLVDVKGNRANSEFSVRADLKNGSMKELEQELWIEGNLSVDYGGELKAEFSEPFSLIFDPFLMKEAINIPLQDIEIRKNTYLGSIIDGDNPVSAAVFPYSQHFIIKQDLKINELSDETDLNRQLDSFLDKTGFKTMSGDDLKKPLYAGFLISALVNLGIILFLLLKLLL